MRVFFIAMLLSTASLFSADHAKQSADELIFGCTPPFSMQHVKEIDPDPAIVQAKMDQKPQLVMSFPVENVGPSQSWATITNKNL